MTALLEAVPQLKELPRAPELDHEELERRAYFHYLDRGCVDGLALEDWLVAEYVSRGVCPGLGGYVTQF
jgi:hypothetical protein